MAVPFGQGTITGIAAGSPGGPPGMVAGGIAGFLFDVAAVVLVGKAVATATKRGNAKQKVRKQNKKTNRR